MLRQEKSNASGYKNPFTRKKGNKTEQKVSSEGSKLKKSSKENVKRDKSIQSNGNSFEGVNVKITKSNGDGIENSRENRRNKNDLWFTLETRGVRSASDSGLEFRRRAELKNSYEDPWMNNDEQSPTTKAAIQMAIHCSCCDLRENKSSPMQLTVKPRSSSDSRRSQYLYPSPIPIFSMEQSFPPVDFS